MHSAFRNGSYRGYQVRLELRRRNRREPYVVHRAADICGFMHGAGSLSAEHMYELLLDTKHRVHGVYLVAKGGISDCHVDPSEIYRAALVSDSPAFALVHNHPSGVVEPSADDTALTRRVAEGAEILNLEFLDSIILGGSRYFSYRESGMMPWRARSAAAEAL